ncbi:MAG: hypothetical protein J5797_11205 [Prevotella sp.]|nr:hypothetical protein [Prevotella sp.]
MQKNGNTVTPVREHRYSAEEALYSAEEAVYSAEEAVYSAEEPPYEILELRYENQSENQKASPHREGSFMFSRRLTFFPLSSFLFPLD